MTETEQQQLPAKETAWIRQRALAAGFELCGVAPAEQFPELKRFAQWLANGYAGEMKYLEDPRRAEPEAALPGAKSLIVCALNYNSRLPYTGQAFAERDKENGTPRGWISRYAWGDDYHEVLWERLNGLVDAMRGHFPEPFEVRPYADTGPVHERLAAKYAGLGWVGKHTLLINQSLGSWLFLGAIITTLPLAPSLGPAEPPPADRCGTCTQCLQACPTQAIVEPYVLDASRCISYLTIEKRGSIQEVLREPMGLHVFGCDICQDVCPWNRKSPRTELSAFQPRALLPDDDGGTTLYLPDLLRIARLSEEQFRESFRGSPIKRTKWRGLIRNTCIALGNTDAVSSKPLYGEIMTALHRLAASDDPAIAESALWALSRIQRSELNERVPLAVSQVERTNGRDV